MKLHHIKEVFCENTGGGTMVDFIELNDGRIIAINEDAAILYASLDDFYDDFDMWQDRQFISLGG